MKVFLQEDQEQKRLHLNESYKKLSILNEAIAEHNFQFTEILELLLFQEDFYAYSVAEIRKNNPGAKVLNLSDSKIAEMYGFDLARLFELTNQYKLLAVNLKFENDLYSIDESVDFGIYAESKQELDRYNSSMKLINALNELRKQSKSQSILNGENIYKFIMTDPNGEYYIPNTFYVKQ